MNNNYNVMNNGTDSDEEVEEYLFKHKIEKELEVTMEITLNFKIVRTTKKWLIHLIMMQMKSLSGPNSKNLFPTIKLFWLT